MPEPIAVWNSETKTWEQSQRTLDGQSVSFSATWPTSGMTRGGRLYELPTSTLRTNAPECSSLLKTPTAQLAVNGGSQHPDKRKQGGHGPTLADEVEHLLPTPRATDGTKGGPNQRGSSGDLMPPSAVVRIGVDCPRSPAARQPPDAVALLPTPSAGSFNDGESLESWRARRDRMKARHGNGNGMGTPLAIAVQEIALLPTPRVAATRTSRTAAMRRDSRSAPSLEQATEIARGELPREFRDWSELPPSWHGDRMKQPSDDGSALSNDQRLGPPNPDATASG